MKNLYCLLSISILSVLLSCTPTRNEHSQQKGNTPDVLSIKWDSPSENSLGSMPAGNGDVGINLWAEKNGDIIFYLSKTDAWSENCRLLKLNKLRLSLVPNPFDGEKPFIQELNGEDGIIQIKAGNEGESTIINIWVDANHPVVEVDITSDKPVDAALTIEPWRTERREITDTKELHSAYGLRGNGMDAPVYVEKDTILDGEGLLWAHRNKRSVWPDNLEVQGLAAYMEQSNDPLLNRTFGGLVRSSQMVEKDELTLNTLHPQKKISASVYAYTSQTETLENWKTQITNLAEKIESISRKERLKSHTAWWHSFWERSYIHVSTQNAGEKEKVFNVSRGYALQRYMNACSGRGNSPVKFNGSIFTVDTQNLKGEFEGFDADYRRWGGPYWWQNTRLIYWSMLEAGDYDLMKPLFRMYHDALPIRKLATKTYYGHKGAFFPETMYFWGTYVNSNYGVDRSELPLGMTQNRFIRYYWQSGLELSLLMLDYYSFTKDEKLLSETLMPVITEVINFYDKHWGRDENGKILFDPAMALETYNTATNPLVEIVGINKVCSELLQLPENFVSREQREQWSRLIQELPEIPTEIKDGKKVLSPAQKYSGKQNMENPEMYAVFPYRAYGMDKSDLELARNTFAQRVHKETGGWQQNAIQAAYLGMEKEAARLTAINFNTWSEAFRFPTMWGPNFDWIPDQDHGSVALIALQRMLLQYDEDKLYLFPAWPKEWDVEFKLHAPQKTTIEGVLKNGEITQLKVIPKKREKDIVYSNFTR